MNDTIKIIMIILFIAIIGTFVFTLLSPVFNAVIDVISYVWDKLFLYFLIGYAIYTVYWIIKNMHERKGVSK